MTGRNPIACAGFLCVTAGFLLASPLHAEIPRPADAPPPLSPEESAKHFKLPPGFRMELVASEPLIHEPSGVCWDEHGRFFVCELHGYNLEGQLDIEDLNKTGKLDREVRRIQADEKYKEAAKGGTYGVVKLLSDMDGDGRMDKAQVWADRLPPCYGMCPARGGIIVACAPDIIFLADTDGDNMPDVREVLFTNFETGALERGINCPTMGLDGWIYFGRGRSGTVHGPRHPEPVRLPGTDFRIKPDGSDIEPVVGSVGTYGFAFTEFGDRFVISTRTSGIFVAPIDWRYLARNPDVASPSMEVDATPDQRVYPTSRPHPWRTRRAEDPGFSKYYSDHYGKEEATPNGYFTSACWPLVYQDQALPGLHGQLLACEPAQNLIHRANVERDGVLLRLPRVAGEETSEFLSSSDPWFHPIALAHGPDGAIWVADFYREIIEDYSAIPRYLQQQYGVVNGKDRGRIWRLVHEMMPAAPKPDMTALPVKDLARDVGSPYSWRRQTARRLLVERSDKSANSVLQTLLRESKNPAVLVNTLYTLSGLGTLAPDDVLVAMDNSSPEIQVHGLRLAERWLNDKDAVREKALSLARSGEPIVLLQLALSLGECRDPKAMQALAGLAREHADIRWMPTAILSSLAGRGGMMLAELVGKDGHGLGKADSLVEPLCASIAARREAGELSQALATIGSIANPTVQLAALRGLRARISKPTKIELTDGARQTLLRMSMVEDAELKKASLGLVRLLGLEKPAERDARLARARADLADIQLAAERWLSAVAELAAEDDPAVAKPLIEAFSTATPRVRDAILAALLADQGRWPAVLDAIQSKTIPPSSLSAVQRAAFGQHKDKTIRERAEKLLAEAASFDPKVFQRYSAALSDKRDLSHGAAVFREKCGICHQAHGVGFAVGPDLSAEFMRAEETIVKDILAPSDAISAGYSTYTILTTDGRVLNGLLSFESAGSVTLRQQEGKEQVVLRKDIDELRAVPVSLMPEDLVKSVSPKDAADIIAWLRSPSSNLVLVDDNTAFASALDQGGGTATFVSSDHFAGQLALRITPLQRHSPQIPGWGFRIREKPGPGEYRYLRFAWKSDGARGVLIELADSGHWPAAGKPRCRYAAGRNTTGWQATEVAKEAPVDWTVVTRDLWKDFGDMTLTGIAPTAIDGPALFDRIELLQADESGRQATTLPSNSPPR